MDIQPRNWPEFIRKGINRQRGQTPEYISTGFAKLDTSLTGGGIQRGQSQVILGRLGADLTTFSLNLARNWVFGGSQNDRTYRVSVVSLRISGEQTITKVLQYESGIIRIQPPSFPESRVPDLLRALSILDDGRLTIRAPLPLDIKQFPELARAAITQDNADILIVDGVEMLTGLGLPLIRRCEDAYESQISLVLRMLEKSAEENNIAVIGSVLIPPTTTAEDNEPVTSGEHDWRYFIGERPALTISVPRPRDALFKKFKMEVRSYKSLSDNDCELLLLDKNDLDRLNDEAGSTNQTT